MGDVVATGGGGGGAGRWEAKGGEKTKQIFPRRNIKYLFFLTIH